MRIADRLRRGAVVPGLRDHRLVERDLAVEHVARDFEVGRAGSAGERLARRHRDHVGDAFGGEHAGGELGDRLHHLDMRQILKRPHLVLGQRGLAADVQDRALGAERRGDAGDGVGAAGAGGGDDAAELAGLAGVAVGGVRGHLLVAHVDDADAFIEAAVVDVDDVAAAEREDGVHTLVLQRLGDETAARNDVLVNRLPVQGIRGCRHGFLQCLLEVDSGVRRCAPGPAARGRPRCGAHAREGAWCARARGRRRDRRSSPRWPR